MIWTRPFLFFIFGLCHYWWCSVSAEWFIFLFILVPGACWSDLSIQRTLNILFKVLRRISRFLYCFTFFNFFFIEISCFFIKVYINSLEEANAFYFNRLIWSVNFQLAYVLLFHFNLHLLFHLLLPANYIWSAIQPIVLYLVDYHL